VKTSVQPSTTTIHRVRLKIPVREPKREDFGNSFGFCLAQKQFLGDEAFKSQYGSSSVGGAFFKCVVQNWYSNGHWGGWGGWWF
jgi:hypothetical protein